MYSVVKNRDRDTTATEHQLYLLKSSGHVFVSTMFCSTGTGIAGMLTPGGVMN